MTHLFPARVGLWTAALDSLPVPVVREQAATLDAQGWGSLWFGEAYGREAFTAAALLLAATTRMHVATGIASIYGRDAMAMAGGARTLEAMHPGRFVLGMGVSHAPLVERMRGHTYAGPLAAMSAYLDAMDTAPYLAAGATAGVEAVVPPRVLAALGPKMLELARDRTAGAHPYLVTPEHTRSAREALGAGPLLVVEQAVVLSADRETFLRRAHAHLEIYTGLPNYRNSWARQGFDLDIDAVRGGSDRLKEALVVHGDLDAVRARVLEHLDAGADHVCLQVLGDTVAQAPVEDWARLAPALVDL